MCMAGEMRYPVFWRQKAFHKFISGVFLVSRPLSLLMCIMSWFVNMIIMDILVHKFFLCQHGQFGKTSTTDTHIAALYIPIHYSINNFKTCSFLIHRARWGPTKVWMSMFGFYSQYKINILGPQLPLKYKLFCRNISLITGSIPITCTVIPLFWDHPWLWDHLIWSQGTIFCVKWPPKWPLF